MEGEGGKYEEPGVPSFQDESTRTLILHEPSELSTSSSHDNEKKDMHGQKTQFKLDEKLKEEYVDVQLTCLNDVNVEFNNSLCLIDEPRVEEVILGNYVPLEKMVEKYLDNIKIENSGEQCLEAMEEPNQDK